MGFTRVIIVGGGFGGLNAAKGLRKAKIDLILFDKKNHHLFQPLLYQVASAALSPADIAIPLREILRDHKNTTVLMGDVIDVDKEKRFITLGNGEIMHFDFLVIAAGARHSYFGNDQWEKFAPGLKTVSDALNIRERLLTSFEKAERCDSIKEASKYLNFVIIGAGPTGVEMAGAIAEIAHKTMIRNFRRIKPEKARIYLLEAAPRVLPPYPEKLSKRAYKDLEKMGVSVMTSKRVTNVTDEGVQLEDGFIESKNVIWAAGNQAAPLLRTLDADLDRQGRVIVEKDLSLPGSPEIFVIGDAAHVLSKKGEPIPAVATAAIQEGAYVAHIIKRRIPKPLRPAFKYFDKGSMATIGRAKAVAYFGKIKFAGLLAWCAWGFIHIIYLIGFRNRFSVGLNWFFHYFSGIRGARLIHKSIEEEKDKNQ
ncbi:MAG: NAD(P)/FAD-dependent oxidoreductase [Chlamydiales bacterium]|nr:NAD(P)/FAD-dependent oxidoreductase [Chlamydiales bacterium]